MPSLDLFATELEPTPAAARFARAGMTVFPVLMPSKQPPPGFRWKLRASADVHDVIEEFTAAETTFGIDNIGVGWALGLDGYLAVDLDGPEPEWWASLGTTAVNPTRRGKHLIFRQPSGRRVGNSTGGFPTEGWGELRGAGGYVVVWWSDRAGFDPLDLATVAEFPWPEWLTDADAERDAVTHGALDGFLGAHTTGSLDRIKGFVTRLDEYVAPASRHEHAVTVACWMAREAAAGLVPAQEAFFALEQWCMGVSGVKERALTMPEVRGIERWAVGQLTPERVAQVRSEADAEQVAYRERQRAETNALFTTTPAEPVIDAAQSSGPWIDWSAFVQRDATARDWLVDRFWPWGRTMAVWADAKAGKSELALWIAVNLALGRQPFTGAAMAPIHVAYFDFEMTLDDLDDRLGDFDVDPRALDHLHYAQMPPIHALNTPEGGRELTELVAAVGAQAVVIDTLIAAVVGDENSSETIAEFARCTGNRLKAMGVGYLRTDHAGREASRGARGSSAKRGDVDIVWGQRRTSGGVLLDCTGSSRVGWVESKLELDRVDHPHVAYSLPIRMGWSAPALAKAGELDTAQVPLDASRRQAADLLAAAGVKPGKTTVLGEALEYRRALVAKPGNHFIHTPSPQPPGTSAGTSGEPDAEII